MIAQRGKFAAQEHSSLRVSQISFYSPLRPFALPVHLNVKTKRGGARSCAKVATAPVFRMFSSS